MCYLGRFSARTSRAAPQFRLFPGAKDKLKLSRIKTGRGKFGIEARKISDSDLTFAPLTRLIDKPSWETTRDISAEELAALRDQRPARGLRPSWSGAYLRPLYWHARRLVVVHEDAEDVVRETFVRAYDRIGTFRGGSDEMGHGSTTRIATNTALTLLRRRKKRDCSPRSEV